MEKIFHKKLTDEDSLTNIKNLHKNNPEVFIKPEIWKKLRLAKLKKEGKNWSV